MAQGQPQMAQDMKPQMAAKGGLMQKAGSHGWYGKRL